MEAKVEMVLKSTTKSVSQKSAVLEDINLYKIFRYKIKYFIRFYKNYELRKSNSTMGTY